MVLLKKYLSKHFRQFAKQEEHALKLQWEEAEKLKTQAVANAIGSLRNKIKDEYALEKEKAVAEALAVARVLPNVFE